MRDKIQNIMTLECAWVHLAHPIPCLWSCFQSVNGSWLPNRIVTESPVLYEADLHYYIMSKPILIIPVIQSMYRVSFGVKNTD